MGDSGFVIQNTGGRPCHNGNEREVADRAPHLPKTYPAIIWQMNITVTCDLTAVGSVPEAPDSGIIEGSGAKVWKLYYVPVA